MKRVIALAAALMAGTTFGGSPDLFSDYKAAGAGPFSSAAGQSAWIQEYPASNGPGRRSCASCHGSDLSKEGRHIKTGKPIAPMALSVNAQRLTEAGKVEKWFRRNCRWTLDRECTPQEKGDFIQFIISQ